MSMVTPLTVVPHSLHNFGPKLSLVKVILSLSLLPS